MMRGKSRWIWPLKGRKCNDKEAKNICMRSLGLSIEIVMIDVVVVVFAELSLVV